MWTSSVWSVYSSFLSILLLGHLPFSYWIVVLCNIFYSVACPFILLMVSFDDEKFLIVILSSWSIISFTVSAFVSWLGDVSLFLAYTDILFSSKSFIVLLSYLAPQCIWTDFCEWFEEGVKINFLHTAIKLNQHYLLKRHSFSTTFQCHLCCKSVIIWGSLPNSLPCSVGPLVYSDTYTTLS